MLSQVSVALLVLTSWAWDPGFVYFAGTVLMILGVIFTAKLAAQAHGPDKIVVFGPVFLGLTIAAFG